MEKKKWKHDCKSCGYVWSVKTKHRHYDVYMHHCEAETTFVARYGNKGEDYMSSPELEHIMMCMYR